MLNSLSPTILIQLNMNHAIVHKMLGKPVFSFYSSVNRKLKLLKFNILTELVKEYNNYCFISVKDVSFVVLKKFIKFDKMLDTPREK